MTFCILLLLCLGMCPESLITPILLIWRAVGFCQRFFFFLFLLASEMIMPFFLSVCLYSGLHWLSHPTSLGWSLLDYGGWCICCVLEFSLWVFYWVFLSVFTREHCLLCDWSYGQFWRRFNEVQRRRYIILSYVP